MYTTERESANTGQHRFARDHLTWDTEVIYTPPSGPPRLVCVASYADAQRIARALNETGYA